MMVADTSVWINLTAAGVADRILRALPGTVAITEVALGELERGRPKGRQAGDDVKALIRVGLAEVIRLDAADEQIFLSLVSGAASETLDDGEAATLTCAQRLGACALIDERKATRLAARRFVTLEVRSTTDILLAPEVGDARLATAIFAALTSARMRVPDHHTAEVIRLLGDERASQCNSLPARLRTLRGE